DAREADEGAGLKSVLGGEGDGFVELECDRGGVRAVEAEAKLIDQIGTEDVDVAQDEVAGIEVRGLRTVDKGALRGLPLLGDRNAKHQVVVREPAVVEARSRRGAIDR